MASIFTFNRIMKLSRLLFAASSQRQFHILSRLNINNGIGLQISKKCVIFEEKNSTFTLLSNDFCTGNSLCFAGANNIDVDKFRKDEEKKDQDYIKEQEKTEEQTKRTSSDQSAENEIPDENDENIQNIRSSILEASLHYVGSYGWTRKAISKGAEENGYPGVTHGMFPNGGMDLIQYFYSKCNEELVKKLKEETNNGDVRPKEPLEFIVHAVQIRLSMIEPYIDAWPQALAIMTNPRNVPKALAQILTLSDDICYYAGDRSVDFGWYTRRIGLASIYKMTELYMLQDSSMEHKATWKFLRNRLEEASQLESILGLAGNSEGITHNVQKTLKSAFITARNILGLDYNRR